MLKKYCAFALCCLLTICAPSSLVFGQTEKVVDNSAAAKIKANVLKRGVSEKKRIKVKKLDGMTLNGYISQIGDDSFDLADSKTKQIASIAYSDVAQIKGGGLSGGATTAITVAVVAGIAVVVLSLFLKRYCNEQAC